MGWLCGLLLLVGIESAAFAEDSPNWRTDLAAARKEAARTGKPLLVVFRCVP